MAKITRRKRGRRRQDAAIATLGDLYQQLQITNRLLVMQLQGQIPQIQIVKALETLGLTAHETAVLLDTSPAVIAVTRGRLRKAQEKTDVEIEVSQAPETALREDRDS